MGLFAGRVRAMRMLHTSDWHASRVWKGLSRTHELALVLDSALRVARREKVDVLLCSGDVFDHAAPQAEAERVVFAFFRQLGELGVQSVVIAGNHDSAPRMAAWGTLAELVRVRVVTQPTPAEQGGVLHLTTSSGEALTVAALPFAPLRTLLSADDVLGKPTEARARYSDGVGAWVQKLTAGFRAESVNVLMAHTHVGGARFSGSERAVHVTQDWAADAGVLPASAHYVALGHLHRPQQVSAPAPTHYAGSPLHLDFGEAGEEKSMVLVDVRVGQRVPTIQRIPYEGGVPLMKVNVSLTQLERDAEHWRRQGHLHITVPLSAPDPDLYARVRRLVPNAVAVEMDIPVAPRVVNTAVDIRTGAIPKDVYAAYLRASTQADPDPVLLDAFEALRAQTAGE